MNCEIVTQRKAAKDHLCYECHGRIKKGEVHTVRSGIYDGDPGRYRHCAHCGPLYVDLNRQIWKDHGEGMVFGTLIDEVQESDRPAVIAWIANKLRRGAEVRAWEWKLLTMAERRACA